MNNEDWNVYFVDIRCLQTSFSGSNLNTTSVTLPNHPCISAVWWAFRTLISTSSAWNGHPSIVHKQLDVDFDIQISDVMYLNLPHKVHGLGGGGGSCGCIHLCLQAGKGVLLSQYYAGMKHQGIVPNTPSHQNIYPQSINGHYDRDREFQWWSC